MKVLHLFFIVLFSHVTSFGQVWQYGGGNAAFSGNVGIGTTIAPATKLEVNGSLSMVRGNRVQFLETPGGANRAFIEGDSSNQLKFHVGSGTGYDAFIINDIGNVGIGTMAPSHLLTLEKASTYPGIRLRRTGTNPADFKIYSGYSQLEVRNSLDQINFVIEEDGKVGLGTDDPSNRLTVYRESDSNVGIISHLSTSNASLFFRIGSTAKDGGIIYRNDGRLSFNLDASNASGIESNEFLTILPSSLVGIGISNPATKLEVNGTISMVRGNRIQFLETPGGNNRAYIEGDMNNQIKFHVGSGAGTDAMIIDASGNVGVGTQTATLDHRLDVNGTIHAEEVKVDLSVPGPDYVFENDYNLLPLSEVEAYVNQNKHLPEVPSAKEMEEHGLNLKEMNLLLLKKVEELTLHLIDQNKSIAEQNNKINEQNQLILRLNERLTKLEKD